jgi:hypothetical protein
LITAARIGATDHCAVAGRVAAGLFSIRHVCGYGDELADGIVSLDDVFTASSDMNPPPQRDGDPAAHAAIATFEPTPRGIAPVLRNHAQIIAAGRAITTAAGLPEDAAQLSATPPSSFAGLAVTLAPWLLSGGRLVLHHPFDAALFRQQAHDCDTVVVPGALAAAYDDLPGATRLIALWRAPERLDAADVQRRAIDIVSFGEFALHAPNADASPAIEMQRTAKGTLAVRGAMVASAGADATEEPTGDGFVDTGYPCRIDPDVGALTVTGPQAGMIGIGGYRIARSDIELLAAALPTDAPITALPDALLGQRLRGRAADPQAAMRAARGANPLIAGAFTN